MIRYGKPIKNKKRRDPRYFLHENLNEDWVDDERERQTQMGPQHLDPSRSYSGDKDYSETAVLELTGPYKEWWDTVGDSGQGKGIGSRHLERVIHDILFSMRDEIKNTGFVYVKRSPTTGVGHEPPAFAFEEQPNSDHKAFEAFQERANGLIRKKLTNASILRDIVHKGAGSGPVRGDWRAWIRQGQEIFSQVSLQLARS